MTSLLIKTVLLAFVLATCTCELLQEIISEGDTLGGPLEDMLQFVHISGCHAERLDPDERHEAMELHNKLRRKIARGEELRGDNGPQPPARNMRVMQYDRTLEDIAFARASMCSVVLPKDTAAPGYKSIFRSLVYQPEKDTPFNISEVLLKRYENVQNMRGDDATNKFTGKNTISGTDLRGYGILVNADTYAFGCAHSTYTRHASSATDSYLICNYANGLVTGERLYKEGEPCEGLDDDCCDRDLVRNYCWTDELL